MGKYYRGMTDMEDGTAEQNIPSPTHHAGGIVRGDEQQAS